MNTQPIQPLGEQESKETLLRSLNEYVESPEGKKESIDLMLGKAFANLSAGNEVNEQYLASLEKLKVLLEELDAIDSDDAKEEKLNAVREELRKLSEQA